MEKNIHCTSMFFVVYTEPVFVHDASTWKVQKRTKNVKLYSLLFDTVAFLYSNKKDFFWCNPSKGCTLKRLIEKNVSTVI